MAPIQVSNILVVKQLQVSATATLLNSMFGKYGDVLKVKVLATTTAQSNFGVIVLNTISAAMMALDNLNGKPVYDKNISISYCPKILIEKLQLSDQWHTEIRDFSTVPATTAVKATDGSFPKNKENIQPSRPPTLHSSVETKSKEKVIESESPAVPAIPTDSVKVPVGSSDKVDPSVPSKSTEKDIPIRGDVITSESSLKVDDLTDSAKVSIPAGEKPSETDVAVTKSSKKKRHRDKSGSLATANVAPPPAAAAKWGDQQPRESTLTEAELERRRERKRKKKERQRLREELSSAAPVVTVPVAAPSVAAVVEAPNVKAVDKPIATEGSKNFLHKEPLFVNLSRLKRKVETPISDAQKEKKSKPDTDSCIHASPAATGAADPPAAATSQPAAPPPVSPPEKMSRGTDAPPVALLASTGAQTQPPPQMTGSLTQTEIGSVSNAVQTDADKRVVDLEKHLQKLTEKVIFCEKMAAEMRAAISTMKDLFSENK